MLEHVFLQNNRPIYDNKTGPMFLARNKKGGLKATFYMQFFY